MFQFLNFDLEYLKQLQSSEPLHAKKASNPPACLVHGLHVLKPRSFSPNRASKMGERYQLFFGLRLASKKFNHSVIQTKTELHFGGFFQQMKVRQPIGRQDSMQTVIRTSRRLYSFLHKAAQNFELLSKIQDQK
jgi:hypothetical protein